MVKNRVPPHEDPDRMTTVNYREYMKLLAMNLKLRHLAMKYPEWLDGIDHDYCPICDGEYPVHKDSCLRQRALRESE